MIIKTEPSKTNKDYFIEVTDEYIYYNWTFSRRVDIKDIIDIKIGVNTTLYRGKKLITVFYYDSSLRKQTTFDILAENDQCQSIIDAIHQATMSFNNQKYVDERTISINGLTSFHSGTGHPLFPVVVGSSLNPGFPRLKDITDKSIKFEYDNTVNSISFQDITGIYLETRDELKNRMTVARWMLFGPLALAMKKNERYLSFDFILNGSEITFTFSYIKNLIIQPEQVFTEIYKVYNEFKKNNPRTSTNASGNNFEEIKKFKELLDIGIITQDEFDKKKKELLNI